MCSVDQKPVFRDLSGEDPDPEVTEIDSLCMNCYKNGKTRLLLTKIPYYKNVVLMSFSCEECGFENNEIQPGGAHAELGVRWKLNVSTPTDLNRQVVKSDHTSVRIPEVDFEIPAQSQKGEVTTVEGIITRAIAGLSQDQETRRIQHPEAAAQIDAFISRLHSLRTLGQPWTLELEDCSGHAFVENPDAPRKDLRCERTDFVRTREQDHALGIFRRDEHPEAAAQIDAFISRLHSLRTLEQPWTLELEDCSGHAFVENPDAPRKDQRCERTDFVRTREQDHALGIFRRDEVQEGADPGAKSSRCESLLTPAEPGAHSYERLEADEVMRFRTNCPECNAPADTNMKLTMIPHFKEVVIMATICDACGHRTNEVKSGGGVEEKGVKFEVRVAKREDFSRDILKSETCSMEIPELELEVGGRALGGRFTTAEGLLRATLEQLSDSPGVVGDAPSLASGSLEQFIGKLQEALDCKRAVTIVLDDPAGNSYCQSLNDDDPTQPDEGLKITRYERSFEQNEELGLNDMKTEGYEES